MLDTISLKIVVEEPTGEYLEIEVMNRIKNVIERLPYCDLRFKGDNYINIRMSYPRFYSQTNAFLISTPIECLNVNKALIESIIEELKISPVFYEFFISKVTFILTRVDVAFTYMMENFREFYQYRNIYNILNAIYCSINKTSIPKEIGVIGSDYIETLIFTDSSNISNYNNKITIYNQAKKISDYYQINQPALYQQVIQEFPDLYQRMRIEGSKRVRRKGFLYNEWINFNIYECYVSKIGEYILNNLFNASIANTIYNVKKEELKQLLIVERNFINFNYEAFIYRYKDIIWDYELLRQAIMELSAHNLNTGYHACSTVRRVLENLQSTTGVIYFGVIKLLNDIQYQIIEGVNKC